MRDAQAQNYKALTDLMIAILLLAVLPDTLAMMRRSDTDLPVYCSDHSTAEARLDLALGLGPVQEPPPAACYIARVGAVQSRQPP